MFKRRQTERIWLRNGLANTALTSLSLRFSVLSIDFVRVTIVFMVMIMTPGGENPELNYVDCEEPCCMSSTS